MTPLGSHWPDAEVLGPALPDPLRPFAVPDPRGPEVRHLQAHAAPPGAGGTDEAVLQSTGSPGGLSQVPIPIPSPSHTLGCSGPHLIATLPSQAIQRRLEEIEVTFRELEQQGIKLEKFLRDEGGKDRVPGPPWCPRLGSAPHSSPPRCPYRQPSRPEDAVDEPAAVPGAEEKQPHVRGVRPHDCVRLGEIKAAWDHPKIPDPMPRTPLSLPAGYRS